MGLRGCAGRAFPTAAQRSNGLPDLALSMVTLVVLPAEGLFVLHGGSGAVAWAIDTPPVQPSVGRYSYNPSAVFGNSTGQLVLMRCLGEKVGGGAASRFMGPST